MNLRKRNKLCKPRPDEGQARQIKTKKGALQGDIISTIGGREEVGEKCPKVMRSVKTASARPREPRADNGKVLQGMDKTSG